MTSAQSADEDILGGAKSTGIFGRTGGESLTPCWQDRELRIDSPTSALQIRPGEHVIDTMDDVEDTKGNNGDLGRLTITNIRLIWASLRLAKCNISIGLDCITSIFTRSATSKLRGPTQALYIGAKMRGTTFEFIFTNAAAGDAAANVARMFGTVQGVHKAYTSTRLYRDLKLRSPVIRNNTLSILPLEQIYDKVHGVWGLSSGRGVLGIMYITNVRVVWHAQATLDYNMSMPYLIMDSVRSQPSKYGPALVIQTSAASGNYLLGFRIDPIEKLKEVGKYVKKLWRMFHETPVFGVEFAGGGNVYVSPHPSLDTDDDDAPLVDDTYTHTFSESPFPSSYVSVVAGDHDVTYDPDLGLAVERIPVEGVTMAQLWRSG
ncbi:Bardet-Biedl syndrome 5 protein [Borealophlyctis nickersoniae]|nr:Bardet-Biedl syndrome 5 protein [Borealophlyctis nickersoniae]